MPWGRGGALAGLPWGPDPFLGTLGFEQRGSPHHLPALGAPSPLFTLRSWCFLASSRWGLRQPGCQGHVHVSCGARSRGGEKGGVVL